MTRCPYGTTCCPSRFSLTGYGCCMIPDAVPCADKWHCCQKGFSCSRSCTAMKCYCLPYNRVLNSSENSTFSPYPQSRANASHFREMLEDSTSHITSAAKFNSSSENITDDENDSILHHASVIFKSQNGEHSNGSSPVCLKKNRSYPCELLEKQTMRELLTIIQARHKHKVTKKVLRKEVLKLYDSIYRSKNGASNRGITGSVHTKTLNNAKHVRTNKSKTRVKNVATGHKNSTHTSFISILIKRKPKKTKKSAYKIKLQKAMQVRKGRKGTPFVRYNTKGVSLLKPSKGEQKISSKTNKNHNFRTVSKKTNKETDNNKKRLQKHKNRIRFLAVNISSNLSEAKKKESQPKTLKNVLQNNNSNVEKLNEEQLVKEKKEKAKNHFQRNVSCNTESDKHSMKIHKGMQTSKCHPKGNLTIYFTSSVLEKTKLLNTGKNMSAVNNIKQRNSQRLINDNFTNHKRENNVLTMHMLSSKINSQSLVKENITKNELKQGSANRKEKLTHERYDGMDRHDAYGQGTVTNVTAKSYGTNGHETGRHGPNGNGTVKNVTAKNSSYSRGTKSYGTNSHNTGRHGTIGNGTVRHVTAKNSTYSRGTKSYDTNSHDTEIHGTSGDGTVRNVTAKNSTYVKNIDFKWQPNGETFKESSSSTDNNDRLLEREFYELGKSGVRESEIKQALAESLLEGEDTSGEKRQKTINNFNYPNYNNVSERKFKSRLRPAKFHGNSAIYGEGSVSKVERGLLNSSSSMQSGSAKYLDNIHTEKNQFIGSEGFFDDDLMREGSSTMSKSDPELDSVSGNGETVPDIAFNRSTSILTLTKMRKKSKLSRNGIVYFNKQTEKKVSDTNLRNHKSSYSPTHPTSYSEFKVTKDSNSAVENFKQNEYKEAFTKQPESSKSELKAKQSDVKLPRTIFQESVSSPRTRKETLNINEDEGSAFYKINSGDLEDSDNTLVRMDFRNSDRKKSSRRSFGRNSSNDLKKKKKFFSKKRIKKKSRDTFESSLSHESVQNSGNVNDKISGMSELDFAPADMDIMQYASTEENDASARSETPFMY